MLSCPTPHFEYTSPPRPTRQIHSRFSVTFFVSQFAPLSFAKLKSRLSDELKTGIGAGLVFIVLETTVNE